MKAVLRNLLGGALATMAVACASTEARVATEVPVALATLPVADARTSKHAEHAARLQSAGPTASRGAQPWLDEARRAVHAPIDAPLPLREVLHFDPARPLAAGFAISASPGQTLYVRVRALDGQAVPPFLDLFAIPTAHRLQRVASTQSMGFQRPLSNATRHVLRVQPPLGHGGRFEITIEQRGSGGLTFPVRGQGLANIGSVFGDARDGGRRKHEGIDIFAERGTPVVAVTAGRVQQTGRSRLGGNIVWLEHDRSPYSTYYAHLDRVTVREGQRVEPGSRLGTVGNTGNARHAPPHLHFGIYQSDRALDPMPFLRRDGAPPPIAADPTWLGSVLRVSTSAAHFRRAPSTHAASLGRLEQGAAIRPVAVRESWFRFRTPDGNWAWMHESVLRPRRFSVSSLGLLKRRASPEAIEPRLDPRMGLDRHATHRGAASGTGS